MSRWKGIVGRGFTPDEFVAYLATLERPAFPTFIVLHNTEVPTFAAWHTESGDDRMRNLESYYRDDQKWSGGPHLFVADDKIWAFTPLDVPGVHSPSWNAISWGVELVGAYNHEPLGDDVKRNGIAALAALHTFAGWTQPEIRLHKEDPKTDHDCPGRNVVKAEFECGIQTYLDLPK